MANSQVYSVYTDYTPQQWVDPQSFQRALTEKTERKVDSRDLVQGRIFWLPSKEELPDRAVKRAHGKGGAIEEGIYNHPVVVISRPAEERRTVHFHLITSLQGKKLDQLYNKTKEFHVSRRSWYLPIAPTPDHPDAISKKTKKRFPTLKLAGGASLRWDSYVNIRHVYKIEWSLLKAYGNPETPNTQLYRFERESSIRLLAKSKILTMYEPGPQLQSTVLKRSISEPIRVSTHITQTVEEDRQEVRSRSSDRASLASIVYSATSSPPWSDFQRQDIERSTIPDPLPKVPPDRVKKTIAMPFIPQVIRGPWDRFVIGVNHHMLPIDGPKPVAISFDVTNMRGSVDGFWVGVKGVMAVAIASM
ncbi:uncharacterized protein K460DRAFT_273571 [Cucurbitaria berberidis CBS 394.84]|uniref:Uncharacterized protein n=1 Tax=Cucurbitaria berberidis CBS 394.84 TaxID=1168544 RepID=A0A9P4GR53_9PLEO|nr:uncharacterized protein K460DRAFT_273571 [Cucurbitaria berberidis CBS 394.84]KAF1849822.1 hypothetical protein K460DRAFT_273571 [Cucurbitaria berberidis CBS 394.84]